MLAETLAICCLLLVLNFTGSQFLHAIFRGQEYKKNGAVTVFGVPGNFHKCAFKTDCKERHQSFLVNFSNRLCILHK